MQGNRGRDQGRPRSEGGVRDGVVGVGEDLALVNTALLF